MNTPYERALATLQQRVLNPPHPAAYEALRAERAVERINEFAQNWLAQPSISGATVKQSSKNDSVAHNMQRAFNILTNNYLTEPALREAASTISGAQDVALRTHERAIPRIETLDPELVPLGIEDIVLAANARADPVQQGARTAMLIEHVQPFANGNARLAYLTLSAALYSAGLPVPRFDEGLTGIHGRLDGASQEWNKELTMPPGPRERALYNAIIQGMTSELDAMHLEELTHVRVPHSFAHQVRRGIPQRVSIAHVDPDSSGYHNFYLRGAKSGGIRNTIRQIHPQVELIW